MTAKPAGEPRPQEYIVVNAVEELLKAIEIVHGKPYADNWRRIVAALNAAEIRAPQPPAEDVLRQYLWLSHGHVGLYGDDGEMQCGICHVDYKRDDINLLVGRAWAAWEQDNLKRCAAQPGTPDAHKLIADALEAVAHEIEEHDGDDMHTKDWAKLVRRHIPSALLASRSHHRVIAKGERNVESDG